MSSLKNFFETHRERITPLAFLCGFILDNLTLTRIDRLFDNLVLFSHLCIAGLSIALFTMFENKYFPGWRGKVIAWLPIAMQFSFGALFSGYLIFYTRSASLAMSWLFVLILVALFIGNEFFKRHYARFVFRTSIFFLALFSFLIFFVPVVLGTLGAWVFVLSGILSLLLIRAFIWILARSVPDKMMVAKKGLIISIGAIYIGMNILYFTNIIPPVPLSLKEMGVYHTVTRAQDGNYYLTKEARKWYEFLATETFHRTGDEPVYVFSSVFAPTSIKTDVFHHWQYFDEYTQEWKSADKIKISVAGGRGGGYRGYSFKRFVFPGRWRVDVETVRGQILGRLSFYIENIEDTEAVVHIEEEIR